MMTKYVLDTSFILAILLKNDKHNNAASELIASIRESSKFLLPGVVLIELALLIKKDPKAVRIISKFMRQVYDVVEIDRKYLSAFIDFVGNTKLNLKPNDYSILHVAKTKNAQLLTFDKRLEQAWVELNADKEYKL